MRNSSRWVAPPPVTTSHRSDRSLGMTINLYPRDIHVQGQPSSHGVADLIIDTNDTTDTRVVLTADLIVSLYRQLAQRMPVRLVTEETDGR